MPISSPTDFYLDLNQLSDMKLGARADSAAASEGVAQQFESLFVQQMLSAMRSAAVVDEASHNSYNDFYQEMYDKQLAQSVASQGGLGIAKFMLQQLPGGQADSGNSGESLPLHDWQEVVQAPMLAQMDYEAENPAVVVNRFIAVDYDILPTADMQMKNEPGQRWEQSSTFIGDVLPQAQRVAETLGVSADLLLAQSALETGWGKHAMRHTDGSSAFNLFGIKAGANWQGDTVSKPTLEFRDGVFQTEIAHFRSYDSVADSLDDYADFIQSSPRYSSALAQAGDDEQYIRELQQAGYATDPNYADKIISIMNGDLLQSNLLALSEQGETTGTDNA